MAFEEKTRVLPAGGQAPACEQLREMVRTVVQDAIRAEFKRYLGAARYERTAARRGHRNGSYKRTQGRRVAGVGAANPSEQRESRARDGGPHGALRGGLSASVQAPR